MSASTQRDNPRTKVNKVNSEEAMDERKKIELLQKMKAMEITHSYVYTQQVPVIAPKRSHQEQSLESKKSALFEEINLLSRINRRGIFEPVSETEKKVVLFAQSVNVSHEKIDERIEALHEQLYTLG